MGVVLKGDAERDEEDDPDDRQDRTAAGYVTIVALVVVRSRGIDRSGEYRYILVRWGVLT
jgi:hypothetical protein